MLKNFVIRLLAATVIYTLVGGLLYSLHDYPQFIQQLKENREHTPLAEKRRWLTLFYFINEAGSGIKFLLTGNERYMAHFPSPSHIVAVRTSRALSGDWEAQVLLGGMYFSGRLVPVNHKEGLHWLRLARINAPATEHAALTKLVKKAEKIADDI